jgi:hypothetical protein
MGFIASMFGGGKKKGAPAPAPTPSVTDDSSASVDREKMRKVGRAALIASSPQGVLGNATTGRQKLLS